MYNVHCTFCCLESFLWGFFLKNSLQNRTHFPENSFVFPLIPEPWNPKRSKEIPGIGMKVCKFLFKFSPTVVSPHGRDHGVIGKKEKMRRLNL